MIVDVFALIDDAPVILKRPLMPYTVSSYRIPIFVNYNPEASNWPDYPYYFTKDVNVNAVLIGGRRYPCMEKLQDGTLPLVPNIGFYTIHVEQDSSYIVIGFDLTTLWMYERIEIILTSQSVYSYYGSRDPDGDPNPPMIISVPEIRKKADALKYAKFSFDTIKLGFIKESQSIFLYGGEIVLSLRHKENENGIVKNFPLGRFIMNKITHNKTDVQIDGIDFRYLLNTKYPNDVFTVEEFKYLQNDFINIIKPAMIGIGNGIPGIPLNGLQIYTDPFVDTDTKIYQYDFQFPQGWTNLQKIEVKQGETWTEIYPGLGNPYARNPDGTDNNFYRHSNNGADNQGRSLMPNIDPATGIVKVHYWQALQDGEYGNDPNEIRMFAKWPNATMKQAITFLLSASNDETLISGFDGEFSNELGEIGLYMDSAEPIFTWIEKLQSANVISGQLMLIDDLLYYRLENPNRNKKLDIPATDVINHEDLSVSIAEDFMYSGWDITWVKSWADKEEGHSIGVNYRYPIAPIYNINDLTVKYERIAPDIQKFIITKLQQRVKILDDLTRTFRHKITNLEIPMYFDYLELLTYDVIGYMPKVLEGGEKLNYEWVIYDIRKNIKSETMVLTLIERIKSSNWNNGNE